MLPHRSARLFTAVAAALVIAAAGTASPADAHSDHGRHERTVGSPINVAGVGFETPESVLYDRGNDVYLVSNINGAGLAPDNNGFISRVAPDGTVVALKWIAGGVNGVTLNAPKGSAISRGKLYVADITVLRVFDANTGAAMGSIEFPGATFLNDVAADRKGNIYVTDIGFKLNAAGTDIEPSGTDALYKVSPTGEIATIAKGNDALHHPNGIDILRNGTIRVVTFDPFDGTKELFTLDKKGRRISTVAMPAGQLDGVIALGNKVTLVSSWETGSIYKVGRKGAVSVLADGLPSPADIGFDGTRHNVLVPIFTENRIVILPI